MGAHRTNEVEGSEAVAAHWMLGRLTVVQATLSRLQRDPDLPAEVRDRLLAAAAAATNDLQSVLEDLGRGVPPLLPELLADPTAPEVQE